MSNRRPSNRMEMEDIVCDSYPLSDRKRPEKGKKRKNDNDSDLFPTWPNQPWYPTVLEISVENPILLSPMAKLLTDPERVEHPLIKQNSFTTAASKVSGNEQQMSSSEESKRDYSQIV